MRFEPDEVEFYTWGLARKNRSPNFYERYAWGTHTQGTVTWFGDGNGYTGRPDIKPETADTFSVSGDWHGPSAQWQLRATSYFTRVQNYIGVLPLCDPACSGSPASQLMFANQRANLYGTDATATYTFAESAAHGIFRITGTEGSVHGEDLSTHTPLYHVMPIHGTVALAHRLGPWNSTLQFQAVARKSAVDPLRREPATAGYSLLNLNTAYDGGRLRLDFAIDNLLDRQYTSPLGGSWQSAVYPLGYAGTTFYPLPAAGRSFDTGFSLTF